jgi:hypothetical protein
MKTKTLALSLIAAALLLVPAAAAKHSVSISNAGDAEPGTYTMNVNVENFKLVPFAGKQDLKGEGHIHYLVNGKDACSAKKADCKAPTDYATTAKSFKFTNLKAGDKLQAELVLSGHGPSGTDAAGDLDGSRVLSKETVVEGEGKDSPAAGILVTGVLLVAALIARRK